MKNEIILRKNLKNCNEFNSFRLLLRHNHYRIHLPFFSLPLNCFFLLFLVFEHQFVIVHCKYIHTRVSYTNVDLQFMQNVKKKIEAIER